MQRSDSITPGLPKVVMLLANEFVHDTRVHKQARSLIEWGCEVHVVAVAKGDLPAREVREGIHVHRLAMNPADIRLVAATCLGWWSRPLVRALVRRVLPSPEVEPAEPRPQPRTLSSRVRARVRGAWVRSRPRALLKKVGLRVRQACPAAFRLLALNQRFAAYAWRLEPDVVQAHDLNTLYAGLVVKRLSGAPLLYDSHELFLERNVGHRQAARDRIVWAPLQAFGIRRCEAVMSVAESICTHLERQYRRYRIARPHLIRNVQPYERPCRSSKLLSEELGIPPHQAVVVYPGAITINRGLEMMIRSAPFLDDAVYVIMGYARNPAYLQSLEEQARAAGVLGRKLLFREAVPIDEVARYTASADLGIVPTRNACLSYYYESSNKIFHCIMAGVPLVMSDHAEKRMLVEQYGVGVLFDETDPHDIARAVNETLADRERYDQMVDRCLRAARILNWEHEEHKLRRIFAGLFGPAAPPIPEVEIAAPSIEIVPAERVALPAP